MESTQPTHEADGQEEWGKHVQDPEGETAAPAQSQSLCLDPGKPACDERWGCHQEPAPDLTGPPGPCRALHFILRARDLASCRERALFATLEAFRCDVEVGRGEREGYHGHTGPRGQMVVGLKVTLTGLRDRVQVRTKGMGCPDDFWEESPFREMGRWE